MTGSERGRSVTVPVSLFGLTAMWVAAVALLSWDTLGGPDVLGKWGLLASAAAAAWTVIYGLVKQSHLIRQAYELGRDTGRLHEVSR